MKKVLALLLAVILAGCATEAKADPVISGSVTVYGSHGSITLSSGYPGWGYPVPVVPVYPVYPQPVPPWGWGPSPYPYPAYPVYPGSCRQYSCRGYRNSRGYWPPHPGHGHPPPGHHKPHP